MRTVTLQEPGNFVLTDTEAPTRPAPGEAIVRVRHVGICGTDLHAYAGRQPLFVYPRVLGHELGLEVVAVGENARGLKAGDSCVAEPYLNCSHCIACRRGRPNCCTTLKVLGVHVDGGMREYISLPIDKLHKVSKLDPEVLPLVETLAIGFHSVARAGLESGENVLVIGAGPIGLAVIAAAGAAASNLSVMELSQPRIEFCRRHFGVEAFIDPKGDVPAQLRELYGELPTTVIDATGSARSMTGAFSYVAAGGQLVFVGFSRDEISFQNPDFHRLELTIKGSRNATSADFYRVIELLQSGEIDVSSWITHRATLEAMIDLYPSYLDPATGVIKAIISV